HEHDRDPAEKPVEIDESLRAGPAVEHAGREQQPPDHRQREERPRDDAARAREVPPRLAHAATASIRSSHSTRPSSAIVTRRADRASPASTVNPPISTALATTPAHQPPRATAHTP